MSVTKADICCEMLEYLEIPVPQNNSGGNSVTIINASSGSRVRKPEPTDSTFVRILLNIQMVMETIGMIPQAILGIKNVTPSVLHHFNYGLHAQTLKMVNEYTKSEASHQTPKTSEDVATARVINKFAGIVGHNCSKAKKLIASTLAFTASAFIFEAKAPHFAFTKKILDPIVPEGAWKELVGDKGLKMIMGASAVFALLSAFWHEMRKPTLGPHYNQHIINQSGLAQGPVIPK